ncbi:hypothetical protein C5B91_18270 [Haloferax sp. Atlit-10N]|nr:hypothetical protein C5B87_09765 [Haloferax sp. Atlit-16N]RDZ56297.1 hypothetical protein C5B91_18270 [Haloferax sp. Atlit-10N]
MALLREPLSDRGTAVRIVVDDAADNYRHRVKYTSLSSGVVTDEWAVFGGSVGYGATESESTFRLSHRMRRLTWIQPLCGRR